jgi:UDP-GlcNAc:undecaprenyl-phosphate/decaprenyl-phosphate GlcNAc-1-phosphate transferase
VSGIPLLPSFLIGLFVFIGSLTGTWLMCRFGRRFGWLAHPREDRWHKKPTCLHGGVGFFPPFFFGSLVLILFRISSAPSIKGSWFSFPAEVSLAVSLLLGTLFMFITGLWDDLKSLRPATKLLCQLVAVSFFVYLGGVFPLTRIPVLDFLLTYLWFIGIINAVNMLDNMDGLSAGVVVISTSIIVFLAWQIGNTPGKEVLAFPVGLILIGSLLGFLFFNRPPAKIFMGDSGSLFIGYGLAALAIPGPLNGFSGIRFSGSIIGPVMVLLIPVTVLAIPIFDTTLVTITRLWRAQKPSEGGRDHASHRLVGLGLSESRAILILYALAAFGGIIAVFMVKFPGQTLPLFGLFSLVLVLSGVYLGHVKIKIGSPDQISPSWTPLISNLLYKRHAAEIILDTFLSILCFYAAHLLRFEGKLYQDIETAMIQALPIVVPCSLLALFVAGIYRGQWRLFSVPDLPAYAFGVIGGTALSLAVITLFTRFAMAFSRSAYIIYGLLFFLALVGSRLSFRLFDVLSQKQSLTVRNHSRKSVLIYGAGKGGKLLYDEIMFNPAMSAYMVLGFIDDNPNKAGRNLCGLPIKPKSQWSKEVDGSVTEIWISSRSIPDEQSSILSQEWNRPLLIKRLRIRMEPLPPPPPFSPPKKNEENKLE